MNANKDAAVSFLQLVTAGKIREAFKKHAAPEFRHHNPHFKGDGPSLIAGMEESDGQFPNKVFEIKRVIGDGDAVAVHSLMRLKPGELEVAVVHIFRFLNDRIVEFWDVGQPVPADSRNSMF